MALVKKADLTLQGVQRVIRPFAPLGGDVCVRVGISQRLEMSALMKEHGERFSLVPALLAVAVVGEGDEQLGTYDDWQALGVQHEREVLELFNAAYELSGLGGEANRKNS